MNVSSVLSFILVSQPHFVVVFIGMYRVSSFPFCLENYLLRAPSSRSYLSLFMCVSPGFLSFRLVQSPTNESLSLSLSFGSYFIFASRLLTISRGFTNSILALFLINLISTIVNNQNKIKNITYKINIYFYSP